MRKALSVALVVAALPVGAAVAGVAGGNGGGEPPGCRPSHETPKKCHPGTTTTVTAPGTTVTTTQTVAVPGPTTTVTLPAPPPTVIVTPAAPGTVNVTVNVNGTPVTVNVPGSVPGSVPSCVNTRKSATLGPLPARFTTGMRVGITSNGHTQFQTVRPGRRVMVDLSRLPCGVYPMVIRHGRLKPALRIWSLTGGNRLTRFWFPGIPGVSGVGL